MNRSGQADHEIAIASPLIGNEEVDALAATIESGWLTQGPRVAAFEELFAEIHGVEHAIATTSCTTALHVILVALGIGPGDEVIVPAFTWVATANVVLHCGQMCSAPRYTLIPSARLILRSDIPNPEFNFLSLFTWDWLNHNPPHSSSHARTCTLALITFVNVFLQAGQSITLIVKVRENELSIEAHNCMNHVVCDTSL